MTAHTDIDTDTRRIVMTHELDIYHHRLRDETPLIPSQWDITNTSR